MRKWVELGCFRIVVGEQRATERDWARVLVFVHRVAKSEFARKSSPIGTSTLLLKSLEGIFLLLVAKETSSERDFRAPAMP